MNQNERVIVFASSDDPLFSSDLVDELKSLGFEVRFCTNSMEVLEQFEPSTGVIPHLLITDSFLQHGSEFDAHETRAGTNTGNALYEKLRESHPKLPVIIHTSSRAMHSAFGMINDPFFCTVYDSALDDDRQIIAAAKKFLN